MGVGLGEGGRFRYDKVGLNNVGVELISYGVSVEKVRKNIFKCL
jgi:hypothetical protein